MRKTEIVQQLSNAAVEKRIEDSANQLEILRQTRLQIAEELASRLEPSLTPLAKAMTTLIDETREATAGNKEAMADLAALMDKMQKMLAGNKETLATLAEAMEAMATLIDETREATAGNKEATATLANGIRKTLADHKEAMVGIQRGIKNLEKAIHGATQATRRRQYSLIIATSVATALITAALSIAFERWLMPPAPPKIGVLQQSKGR